MHVTPRPDGSTLLWKGLGYRHVKGLDLEEGLPGPVMLCWVDSRDHDERVQRHREIATRLLGNAAVRPLPPEHSK